MRALALFLLLLNIVFFMWQQSWLPYLPWQPTHIRSVIEEQTSPHTVLPQLTLLRERDITVNSTHTKTSVSQDDTLEKLEKKEDTKPLSAEKQATDNDNNKTRPSTNYKALKTLEEETLGHKVISKDSNHERMLNSQLTIQTNANSTTAQKITLPDSQQVTKQLLDTKPAITNTKSGNQDKLSTPLSIANSAEPVQAIAEEVQPKTQLAFTSTCFEIGPYSQIEKAKSATYWFKDKKNVQIKVQNREIQVPKYTRVYLPSFRTLKAARRVQQHLLQLGIVDHHIMPENSRLKNAISLGVYRDQTSVERRLKELQAKGYKDVKTEKIYKNGTGYWLNVKIPDSQEETKDAIEETFKDPSPALVKCSK